MDAMQLLIVPTEHRSFSVARQGASFDCLKSLPPRLVFGAEAATTMAVTDTLDEDAHAVPALRGP
jgi:hypothetical protein